MNTQERPARHQLVTARMLVAQFEAQITEFEGLNREGRRTPRGRDLTARIDGLRTGHAKLVARVAELEHEQAPVRVQCTGRHEVNERSTISVYPVGLLHDLKLRRVRRGVVGYLIPLIRRREWRAVRNYFNGYLAEINYPPASLNFYRCGRGWTKRSALSSLGRRLGADNPEGGTK